MSFDPCGRGVELFRAANRAPVANTYNTDGGPYADGFNVVNSTGAGA